MVFWSSWSVWTVVATISLVLKDLSTTAVSRTTATLRVTMLLPLPLVKRSMWTTPELLLVAVNRLAALKLLATCILSSALPMFPLLPSLRRLRKSVPHLLTPLRLPLPRSPLPPPLFHPTAPSLSLCVCLQTRSSWPRLPHPTSQH